MLRLTEGLIRMFDAKTVLSSTTVQRQAVHLANENWMGDYSGVFSRLIRWTPMSGSFGAKGFRDNFRVMASRRFPQARFWTETLRSDRDVRSRFGGSSFGALKGSAGSCILWGTQ
jgi:hypothetical protein